MTLSKMVEPERVNTILGVDASTNSFAFCVFDHTGPVRWGEINFKGTTIFKRIIDGGRIIRALSHELNCDMIAIESSVYVNNKSTVIGMAYSVGMILSSLGIDNIVEYKPLEWQKFVNNPPLKKAEKDKIKADFPGKSASWYSSKGRETRKERTRQWVKDSYGYDIASDNVTDAFGIGFKAWSEYGKR